MTSWGRGHLSVGRPGVSLLILCLASAAELRGLTRDKVVGTMGEAASCSSQGEDRRLTPPWNLPGPGPAARAGKLCFLPTLASMQSPEHCRVLQSLASGS